MPTSVSTPGPYFTVRRSRIQGRGAFALRPIRKGTRIIEYTGERISQQEADRRYDDAAMARHHTFLFALEDGTVIDGAAGGNESRLINHSCEPNCEAVMEGTRIFIHALRSIAPGEELSYDYAYERTADHGPEDERLYACHCGSPACRGTILAPKRKRSPAAGKRAPRERERGKKRSSGASAGTRTRATGARKGPASTRKGTGSARERRAVSKAPTRPSRATSPEPRKGSRTTGRVSKQATLPRSKQPTLRRSKQTTLPRSSRAEAPRSKRAGPQRAKRAGRQRPASDSPITTE